LDLYSHLQAMGFGLKELRLLWNMIGEISEANKINHQEAVSKFLKDIEEQYDDKLGFEKKINEKKGDIALINRELDNNRQNLFLNALIGPSLSNLLQKGIGEQDIININQLVEICTGNTGFSNPINGPLLSSNQNIKYNDTHNINIKSRSEYWKGLIEELKKYENIKVALKKQQEKHDELQKQVNHLEQQRQEISSYLQIAISFINAINNKIYYFKGFLDQFNKDLNYRNILLSSKLSNPFIFIINNNNDSKRDKENQDK